MRSSRRILVVAALVMAILLPATAANANPGGYTIDPMGGVVTQTNTWFASGTAAWTSAPAGTAMTNVYWTYNLSSYANVVAALCAASLGCLVLPTGVSSGGTTAFAGYPPNQTWYFLFGVQASTTYVLSPPRYGGLDTVTVNYQ